MISRSPTRIGEQSRALLWATGLPSDPPYDPPSFLFPGYWLAWCEEWPQSHRPTAEAMFATAPQCLRKSVLSSNAQRLLTASEAYAAARPDRLVFVSDVSAALGRGGAEWADLDIDLPSAIDELFTSTPGLHLTVSHRAHFLAAWPGLDRMVFIDSFTGRETNADPQERERVREALLALIERDWPGFAERAMIGLLSAAT